MLVGMVTGIVNCRPCRLLVLTLETANILDGRASEGVVIEVGGATKEGVVSVVGNAGKAKINYFNKKLLKNFTFAKC